MTDKARQAIAYLRRLTKQLDDIGMAMSASYMTDFVDTIEAELRRCRAETLREAATAMRKHAIDRRIALMHPEFVAQSLECMADDAEREADHDA